MIQCSKQLFICSSSSLRDKLKVFTFSGDCLLLKMYTADEKSCLEGHVSSWLWTVYFLLLSFNYYRYFCLMVIFSDARVSQFPFAPFFSTCYRTESLGLVEQVLKNIMWMSFLPPAISIKALKGHQSTNSNQRQSLVLSAAATGLLMKECCCLCTDYPTPLPCQTFSLDGSGFMGIVHVAGP